MKDDKGKLEIRGWSVTEEPMPPRDYGNKIIAGVLVLTIVLAIIIIIVAYLLIKKALGV